MSKTPSLEELIATLEKELSKRVLDLMSSSISKLKSFDQEVALNVIKDAVSSVIESIKRTSPESVFYYLIDVMFAPNQIVRQVGLIISLHFAMLGWLKLYKLTIKTFAKFTARGRLYDQLSFMLENSKTYEEWSFVANELDRLKGFDKWRKEDFCPFMDFKSVIQRTRDTQDMMKKGDVFNLMFRLRGGLSRTQFGLQHEGLYTRALAGTKNVVEKYNETISAALNLIADTPPQVDNIPSDAKLAFFNETRHAYGRTALMLSGGASMGFYHIGVCTALFKQNLLPRVISGASAGSLVAALICTRTDEELDPYAEDFADKHCYRFFKFTDHIDSPTGQWFQYFTPSFLKPYLNPLLAFIFDGKIVNLDTEHFKNEVIKLAGLWTFQEAFDRTGRIINITVAPPNPYDPPRLLNYLTAPHVCIWSATAASCALPGAFDSFHLVVKEPNGNFSQENLWTRQVHGNPTLVEKSQGYTDGSIDCDLPMKQLSELFNVSHFIISQANPHAALLSSLSFTTSVWSNPFYGGIVAYIQFLIDQFRDSLKNFIKLLVSRSLAPTWSAKRGFLNIISQDYEGRSEDIMIFPWKSQATVVQAFMRMFDNPTLPGLKQLLIDGERETWHLLSRIQANSQVELTLDRCVQRLRRRVAEENEDLDTVPDLRKKESSSQKKLGDRFYTSRSIVNLSGLSVSDPLPKSQPSNPIYYYDDESLNLTVKGDDVPLKDKSQISPMSGISFFNNLLGGSADSDIEAPRAYGLPGILSRQSSVNSTDSNLGMNLDASDRPDWKDSLGSRGTKKTTNMANFYYRDSSNAPSNESLSKLT